ncbi:MAG: 16S rRNA (uracil(1498)-N(3))-methyltransferase [Pseudomonadota bacterium]|nr:16S rRNA (uracil(1498)-N(3))-methyltransferase [Pseudomonadota bacterium]
MRQRQTLIRLFTEADLRADQPVALTAAQSHYLTRVMRRGAGDSLLLFNGRDGEWRASLAPVGKRAMAAWPAEQTRPQPPAAGPWLVFGLLKKGPSELIVEKATELGAARISPVRTARTAAERVKDARLTAHAVEAAEQCERLDLPRIDPLRPLDAVLAAWPTERRLLVAAERAAAPPLATRLLREPSPTSHPDGLLIGPEGGFDDWELDRLRELPFCSLVSLGPRILRAETAAIAALACWQSLAPAGALDARQQVE